MLVVRLEVGNRVTRAALIFLLTCMLFCVEGIDGKASIYCPSPIYSGVVGGETMSRFAAAFPVKIFQCRGLGISKIKTW